MGNSYCQTPTDFDPGVSNAQTAEYSHCRPFRMKPSQPIRVVVPVQVEDDIEPMVTTNRNHRQTKQQPNENVKRISFVQLPRRNNKVEQSVQQRMSSAMKQLSNSYSTGHLKSHSESKRAQSRHSSTKKLPSKELAFAPNQRSATQNSFDKFLKGQKEFVEKRKRSIEHIRKLLEIKQDKENPHQPKLNIASTTKARTRHFGRPTEGNLTSSAMFDKSINAQIEGVRTYGKNYLSDSVESASLATRLKQARSEIANQDEAQKLLFELQEAMSKLLLVQNDGVSFLLFVNLMRTIHMTSQAVHAEGDGFLNERELLHDAWLAITNSHDLLKECTQRELAQFLVGLYGFEISEENALVRLEAQSFSQLKTRYQLFRANRAKPPQIVCQDYMQENCSAPLNCQLIDSAPILMAQSCQQPHKSSKPTALAKSAGNPLKIKRKPKDMYHPAPQNDTPKAQHPQQVIYETFNTFNPQSVGSKRTEELDGATTGTRKTVLQIDVDLGDRTQSIRVAQDEEPDRVAHSFLEMHGLPNILHFKLAALIREGLSKVKSQQ